ncbi:MAG: hypothetical protein M3N15_07795 [Actinomycetota bacterium]|nr:hypothetical protein [Actinomycetota bacterium]
MVIALNDVGVLADVLVRRLRPSPERPGAMRTFAAAVPAALWLTHFALLWLTASVGWSVELWVGITGVSALTGLGLSLLVVPPGRVAVGRRRARHRDLPGGGARSHSGPGLAHCVHSPSAGASYASTLALRSLSACSTTSSPMRSARCGTRWRGRCWNARRSRSASRWTCCWAT